MENTLVDAAVQAGALIGSAFEKLSNLFVYGPIVFVFMLVVVLLLSRQLTKFVRNGKEISVTDTGYLMYAKLWYAVYPVRRCWMKLKSLCRRLIRRRT